MCRLDHLAVWKLTAPLLLENVSADKYSVYVPKSELKVFKRNTPQYFEILEQEELSIKFRRQLSRKCLEENNKRRFGWYLQQFMKFSALETSSSEKLIIWDSDCVPTSNIQMFDEIGRPLYMFADEYNPVYFALIDRLLGLKRVQHQSFVIPGFPINKSWFIEFIDFIENRFQTKWYEALLENIDFSLPSGFSETETLGTWVANNYSGQWDVTKYKWDRGGQSKFGYPKKLSPRQVQILASEQRLDVVSFEKWDYRGLRLFISKVKRAVLS